MPLYAGVCETNITPPPDGWLGGRGSKRRCTGVHNDLYARVLVLDNGQERVALIAVDIMAVPEEWTQDVRQRVADDLHTQPGAIMLHYAGGRGGPAMPALNEAGEYDHAYMEILKRKIAGAARQAANALLPASLTYGEASAQIGVHQRLITTDDKATRLDDYGGPVSSLVQTLCVNGADGQTFALLFAHACAPDTQGDNNTCITADWPGAAVAHLRRRFQKEAADTGIASDALPFCLLGCGANVAPLRRGSWEAVQTNGRIIADAAHTARWNAHGRLGESLQWAETTVSLPLDSLSVHQTFTIQKLNLGGVTILGFSAEMRVECQQMFHALSSASVFCLGTTNGSAGVLPPDAEPERDACHTLLHAAVQELLQTDTQE